MIVRKIETRERAEELLGGCVVGPRRICFDFENTKVPLDTSNHYVRAPLLTDALLAGVVVVAHALKGGSRTLPLLSIAATLPAIACIFRSRTNAEIAASIVEGLAADVIHHHAIRRVHNQTRHGNFLRRIDGGVRVDRIGAVDLGIPSKAADERIVFLVNNSYCPAGEVYDPHAALA